MGLADLFKEQPEVREERKRQEQYISKERELDIALARVRFFPGSKEEYEAHVGYQVRIINTGNRNMGLTFGMSNEDLDYNFHGNFDFKKKLIDEGIEAVINCNYSLGGNNLRHYHRMYGLPVAKK